ncbi:hypothetical protein RB653_005148 [Dictyostelium firmibasis]|uniref:Uncharacterized protein n=1 Tax=Dictyostelium firmibasis TaxID=79012 RepID=A0AAN7YZ00_9MYCE
MEITHILSKYFSSSRSNIYQSNSQQSLTIQNSNVSSKKLNVYEFIPYY